ncbi:ABC transporter permease [Mesobacillus maritimus]|uniref:ABC transporter permease n=1 Tax=Mesobacillus maritimus TaxID=1643336 RepID=UPI00384E035B
MRKVLTITWLRLKTMLKSPGGIVLMFVMPLIFSVIFGGISGKGTTSKPLVLLVADKSEPSREAVALLEENTQYQWREAKEIEAREQVKAKEAIAAVILAEDYSLQIENEQPIFEVINQHETQEYLALQPIIEGVARTIVSSHQLASEVNGVEFPLLLKELANREAIKIEREIIQKDGNKGEDVSLLAVGFTIMFMMFGISGAASTILDERKGGTWQRLLTTPATKGQLIVGYLLSYFLLGWIQMLVLMVAMSTLFGAVWGNLAYFIPFASIVILTIVGFGLMMAGLVKTSQQAGALSAVLIVSSCMLGGVYWPLEIVPEFMQEIAKAVPQSWMMSGLREIISGSLHISSLVKAVGVLLGFSLFFYSVGLKKIKYH